MHIRKINKQNIQHIHSHIGLMNITKKKKTIYRKNINIFNKINLFIYFYLLAVRQLFYLFIFSMMNQNDLFHDFL